MAFRLQVTTLTYAPSSLNYVTMIPSSNGLIRVPALTFLRVTPRSLNFSSCKPLAPAPKTSSIWDSFTRVIASKSLTTALKTSPSTGLIPLQKCNYQTSKSPLAFSLDLRIRLPTSRITRKLEKFSQMSSCLRSLKIRIICL